MPTSNRKQSARGMPIADYQVEPGSRVRLNHFDPHDTRPFKDKNDAAGATEELLHRLAELQGQLYAEARQSLLVVLQGMDTSGKDGTIEHVFRGLNPQGCSVASFKAPSLTETAHDYLWRVHHVTPARGMIQIFN